jgi:exodeoxyribonuclease V beta subunit
MQRFDCLSLDCPLFGPHLLESSAGTGKTFSIEHIYVRLILQSMDVEQILVMTFTRAAARELKSRIRLNLEKALRLIQSNTAVWPYLEPHLGSKEAVHKLSDALALFDQCQIFTIHSFCYRMLKEFAFEAGVGSLSDPDQGKKLPDQLKKAVGDFLENGIDPSLLCPEQVMQLTKQFASIDELKERLLFSQNSGSALSFSELFAEYKAAIQNPENRDDLRGPLAKCKAALHLELEEKALLEDFRALEKGYKATVKGDFEAQVKALANMEDPCSFRLLLKEKGSLFDFLDPENRKIRFQEPAFLHYPGFFDWARENLAPFMKQKAFPILQGAWQKVAEKVFLEEEYLGPDEIVKEMAKAIENPAFSLLIQKKYAAVIVDEFQDTDAMQWEIFQRLFFNEAVRALYLVGDPKQSIYRFRKADVYTYLKARDFLKEENLYLLDTNFRSSKSLIGALNALFDRNWLHLPKTNRTLPYIPLKAGAKVESNFGDGKGSLHFFVAEGEPSSLFDEFFLPFTISEIERLGLKQCAVLVKDRYQAEKVLEAMKKRNIAAVAKSHTPLGETDVFQSICELFHAVMNPRDQNAVKIAMAGPFAKEDFPFADYKNLLHEKGLIPFAKRVLKEASSDVIQIFELLFEWEKKEGFSFEGLNRFLRTFKRLNAEEGGMRRMEVNDEAIQIMTMHISKGLEFDVVFALGLSSRTPSSSQEVEELDAEKKRQLYVAMTRAKKRLYVPLALSKVEPELGTASPLELFEAHFEGPLLSNLAQLSQKESITIEHLSAPLILDVPVLKEKEMEAQALPLPLQYTPSYLSSFTTLANTSELKTTWVSAPGFTLQTMPRGAETGIVIHQIFEALFSSKEPIWRTPLAMDLLVENLLKSSSLMPWKEAIQQMVRQVVSTPLQAEGEFFCLNELEPHQVQVEMEFLFSDAPHLIKGFIDLVFCYGGRFYFVDWKTNWLDTYEPNALQEVMKAHDYTLQASLYAKAMKLHFKEPFFGAAFYLFVRGCAVVRIDGAVL